MSTADGGTVFVASVARHHHPYNWPRQGPGMGLEMVSLLSHPWICAPVHDTRLPGPNPT